MIKLSLLLLLLTLMACKKNKQSNEISTLSQEIGAYTDAEIKEISRSQHVTCSKSFCPEGVAKVISIDLKNKISVCSAFLIEADTLLTNRHCLPDDLIARDNVPCKGRMFFTFKDNKNLNEQATVGCQEIISSTPDKDSEMDYAIIRLERSVAYKTFTLRTEGIKDSEKLTVWKVDHHNSPTKGSIKSEKCQSVMNSILVSSYTHKFSKMLTVGARKGEANSCFLQGGNSGSVIIDEEGLAVAIVSHNFDSSDFIESDSFIKSEKGFVNLGIAQNISCINKAPIQGRGCKLKNTEDSFTNKTNDLIDKLNSDIYELNIDGEQQTQWAFINDDDEEEESQEKGNEDQEQEAKNFFYFSALPKCYKDNDMNHKGQIELSAPTYKIKITFDEYLRMNLEDNIEKDKRFHFSIHKDNPKGLTLKLIPGQDTDDSNYKEFSPITIDQCD